MSILKYFSEQKETMKIIKTKFPIGGWVSIFIQQEIYVWLHY